MSPHIHITIGSTNKSPPPGCVALLTLLESPDSAHHGRYTLIPMPSYTDLRKSSLPPPQRQCQCQCQWHDAKSNRIIKTNPLNNNHPPPPPPPLGVPIKYTLRTPLSHRADGRKHPRDTQLPCAGANAGDLRRGIIMTTPQCRQCQCQ